MQKKIKILFVLPTLTAGGAQRVLSFLALNVNPDKFETHLLIIGKSDETAYNFEITKTTFLNKKRVLEGIPSIIYYLINNRPQVVLSSIGHLNTVFGLLSPFFFNIKFIIREASVVSEIEKFSKTSKLGSFLSQISFKNADMVVCQSRDMADDFKRLYKTKAEKITIINNPIMEVLPLKNKSKTHKVIKFITIGRLSIEKGHLRILELLTKVPYPFHYTIIGSGPEKINIENKIAELGMEEKINHILYTKDVGNYLINHDFFLQGSYVEGFPNALLESCVVGTPVIAFDVPGGTKEIIVNGVNGIIVNQEDDYLRMLNTISNMNWNPKIVRETVINKFDKKKILNQYEDLFIKICSS